jgi:hypothetical protein
VCVCVCVCVWGGGYVCNVLYIINHNLATLIIFP